MDTRRGARTGDAADVDHRVAAHHRDVRRDRVELRGPGQRRQVDLVVAELEVLNSVLAVVGCEDEGVHTTRTRAVSGIAPHHVVGARPADEPVVAPHDRAAGRHRITVHRVRAVSTSGQGVVAERGVTEAVCAYDCIRIAIHLVRGEGASGQDVVARSDAASGLDGGAIRLIEDACLHRIHVADHVVDRIGSCTAGQRVVAQGEAANARGGVAGHEVERVVAAGQRVIAGGEEVVKADGVANRVRLVTVDIGGVSDQDIEGADPVATRQHIVATGCASAWVVDG